MRNIVSPLDGIRSPFGLRYGTSFSPASLFAAGEQGVWYDPSDFSTMFQDAAGTTPVTAVEQPVRLLLDKSQGLVLGSELVTNGDFSAGSAGWTVTKGTVTFSGGGATFTPGADTAFRQTISLVSGKSYQVTFDLLDPGNYGVNVLFSGVSPVTQTFVGTGSKVAVLLNGAANTRIEFDNASNLFAGTIDNVSVKLLSGNHAFQSTNGAQPTLSARVNLLTYSAQFDNSAWTKGALTVSANTTATTDPLGGNTADKLQETATTAEHYVLQGATVSAAQHTFSVYLKAAERTWATIYFSTGSATPTWFNLAADGSGGVGTVASGFTAASIYFGNGWYRCSITGTSTAATWYAIVNPSLGNGVSINYAGTLNSGIYLWGADLRPTNQTTLLPAYQRIAAATDYDTTGFPYYLRFDGTDDSMATGTINFSATDKMSVFAGVRKLAVSFGSFATLGALNAAGQFDMAGVTSAGVGYYVSSLRGNSGTEAGTRVAPYLDPITNVVQTSFDIAGATRTNEISIRVNGIVPANQSENPGAPGPAGGGNFGNYPLYIGSRGGSSLRFNGNIYSLIVLGRTATAAEITNTETYVNSKTLAY